MEQTFAVNALCSFVLPQLGFKNPFTGGCSSLWKFSFPHASHAALGQTAFAHGFWKPSHLTRFASPGGDLASHVLHWFTLILPKRQLPSMLLYPCSPLVTTRLCLP